MPRSPSRDLTDRYERNRGYFHRLGFLARAKYWLSLAALLLVVCWVVADVLLPRWTARAHTHGKLASAHASWESKCDACHVGFTPSDAGLGSLFGTADRWDALTCEKCHPGPPHSPDVDSEGAEFHARCANCHHDHNGRSSSLVFVADQYCTRCHADLAAHHRGTPSVNAHVGDFFRDHPEFDELARHPADEPYAARPLKFNHSLHLTPGLTYRKGAKGALTLRRLAELAGADAAKRYRLSEQADDARVSLTCSSCHQIEEGIPKGTDVEARLRNLADPSGRATATMASRRTEGAYYVPVHFDTHCKACHPLRTPAAVSGSAVVAGVEVPHGRQPGSLRELIAGAYSRRLLDEKNPARAAMMGPGGRFDPRQARELASFQAEIERLTDAATASLVPGGTAASGHVCGKCHEVKGKGESARIAASTRPVWFGRARFSHLAHRGVGCIDCHTGTDGSEPADRFTGGKEPIRIAGVAKCRECHGPERTVEGEVIGGVRHACTDCHRYHKR